MMQVELIRKICWGGIFREPGEIVVGPVHLINSLVAEGNARFIEDEQCSLPQQKNETETDEGEED